MNQEEPNLTLPANQQISTTGVPLTEEAQQPMITSMPRSISILTLIHQWQPMGIRIILDLPFIGNDYSYIFLIRNGPFIPRWDKKYANTETRTSEEAPSTGNSDNYRQYAWNNMRNVFVPAITPDGTSNIHFTQYDYPPILSSISQSFRRWRGDMQYRIRTIAGFATQGYLVATTLKNEYSPIGIYDEYSYTPDIRRPDRSYRSEMMNSYVMADTSMFRHIEITSPYEYPAPYYDQYAWMARRVSPKFLVNNYRTTIRSSLTNEPHGDNFICLGLRGNIGANTTGAQIIFELEYRAMEGFQFADPGLPPLDLNLPYSTAFDRTGSDRLDLIKSIPDKELSSDGVWAVSKRGAQAPVQAYAQVESQARRVQRRPRDLEFS